MFDFIDKTQMKNVAFNYCLLLSIICWIIPFLCRVFFIELPEIPNTNNTQKIASHTEMVVNKVLDAYNQGEHKTVFVLIYKNNMRCCFLNAAGGAFLGIGTLLNQIFNGVIFADVSVNTYKSGLDVMTIFKITLPHSFELVGIWLSGAVGFYIAWNIIQVIRGKEGFTIHFYKILIYNSVLIFLIILSAAYVEAYTPIKL